MRNEGFFSRDVVAAIAGLTVGVVASRFLPPLVAQMWGTARARFGQDPFAPLLREHRRIESLIEQMERGRDLSTVERTRLFLTLKHTIARHAFAEEDVVYPVLSEDVHEREDTKQLYDQHADIKICLYEIEQCLMRDEDWTEYVRALREVITGHIRDEEEVQFPKLRQALDEKRVRKLSGFIRREEAMVL